MLDIDAKKKPLEADFVHCEPPLILNWLLPTYHWVPHFNEDRHHSFFPTFTLWLVAPIPHLDALFSHGAAHCNMGHPHPSLAALFCMFAQEGTPQRHP